MSSKSFNRSVNKLSSIFFCLLLMFGLLLTSACNKDPQGKFDELMAKAAILKSEKKWEDARITLLNAAKENPQDARVQFELAEVQSKLNQLAQAVNSYRNAVDLDPNFRQARLHLAGILIAAGAADQAEEHVDRLLQQNPEDLESLILKSSLERFRGREEEAKRILEQVLAKDPENKAAIATMGSVALEQGNLEDAEKNLKRALAMDPENGPLKLALVDLSIRKGQMKEAEDGLAKLAQDEPNNASLRYFYAEFLFARGQTERAKKEYEHALVLDFNKHIARDRLYDLYLSSNQRDAARKLVADLEASDPKSVVLTYFHGRNKELEKQDKEALKLYISTIQQIPSFAPAFRRAGLVEFITGDFTSGLEHLNQAVALDPHDIGARMALGRYYFRKRDYSNASIQAKRILTRYPYQVGASILLADIALVDGKTEDARRIYEMMNKAFPGNPEGLVKMGLLEERETKPEKALEYYRKAVAFDGDISVSARRIAAIVAKQKNVDVAIEEMKKLQLASQRNKADYDLIIGQLYMAKGQPGFEHAKTSFNKAIEEKPVLTEAYLSLAAIAGASGNLDQAIAQWRKYLERNPKHVPTMMMIGVAYESMNNKKEAALAYREILKISPRFGPAANNLAWVMSETEGSDLNEALELAEVANQEIHDDPNVQDTLAWIHYKKGTPRIALPILEDAVESARKKSPQGKVNPEILYHLGVIRLEVGDKKEAKEVLIEAKKGSDQRPELLQKIEQTLSKI